MFGESDVNARSSGHPLVALRALAMQASINGRFFRAGASCPARATGDVEAMRTILWEGLKMCRIANLRLLDNRDSWLRVMPKAARSCKR